MTREDIIRMAQECQLIGMRPHLDGIYQEALERFAALVAEREREECAAAAMRVAEMAVDAAIKLEREACAKLFVDEDCLFEGKHIAAAIRARGEK